VDKFAGNTSSHALDNVGLSVIPRHDRSNLFANGGFRRPGAFQIELFAFAAFETRTRATLRTHTCSLRRFLETTFTPFAHELRTLDSWFAFGGFPPLAYSLFRLSSHGLLATRFDEILNRFWKFA